MKFFHILTIVLPCLSFVTFAQNATQVEGKDLPSFISNLTQQVYEDTIKFSRDDLLHTQVGSRNKKGYSKLYMINGKYAYKLDIIAGELVEQFVKEVLVLDKIESICIRQGDISYSQSIYGSHVVDEVIHIKIKAKARFNPKVGGLKKKGKTGNNFEQRLDNEILIRI
ncbi:hypothetical protein [Flammeovirga sp. SJP92]|uniref:hypothetical protein n=1 Tax=Flammeovirga sp. SJP92 TaxID=1775430 RepID=UPI0007897864|nr:hypothetical protein [Flammeovirga sp. SJP92]KXX69794.1 hypothetical protein AVL50_12965 [Flammeovirga sp. SJP92]